MGKDIEQAPQANNLLSLMLPVSEQAQRPDRYERLPVMSREGELDRRHERQHVLAMHDLERSGRQAVAREALAVIEEVAAMEALSKVTTEAKYRIQRANLESRIIAGEDPVLQAQFAILDDQMALTLRQRAQRWMV